MYVHFRQVWIMESDSSLQVLSNDNCVNTCAYLLFFVAEYPCNRENISHGQMRFDNFTCPHIEKEVADQTRYLSQTQCMDTSVGSPSADPMMSGMWQGTYSARFVSLLWLGRCWNHEPPAHRVLMFVVA